MLSEFNIVYVTQKAIKESALADYLAEYPLNGYQPMHPKFPDEDIMALFEEKLNKDRDKWIVWFDVASNVRWGIIGLSEQSMHTFHGQALFRMHQ